MPGTEAILRPFATEMRHLTSDTTLARSAGYKPAVDLSDGIHRYIDWIRTQSDIRDYFSEAEKILRSKGIVHRVEAGARNQEPPGADAPLFSRIRSARVKIGKTR